jgi:hypothetical protein
MQCPRAADEFRVIRARLLELQRERDHAVRGAANEPRPKPYHRPLDRTQVDRDDREEFRPFRERFVR